MSVAIIRDRLESYDCQSRQDAEHALREITQEIALMGLSRSGFFKHAAFHGGSCLRIVNGLNRFSEDLDFLLQKPAPDFRWQPFVNNLQREFAVYGYDLSVQDRSESGQAMKKMFLKDDSLGKILNLRTLAPDRQFRHIRIKLEVDTNPPAGSEWELQHLDFPMPHAITVQNPASAFALKSHALLCRPYIKGRDWFDFVWYVSRRVAINFPLLTNAIRQAGPWQDCELSVTRGWFLEQMSYRISHIDWTEAKRDIARFLRPIDIAVLELWTEAFFLSYLDRLAAYLPD